MPKFDVLPLNEAQLKSASGKRAELLREYINYIDQVPPGQAGCLQAGPGETVSAVRRRLGAAARASGKIVTIKRVADQVYFWVDGAASGKRRRGRPRTNPV